MYAFLTSSLFLCVVVSLAAYAIGVYLHNKLENDLVNPLLIAIALVLVFLLVTGLREGIQLYQFPPHTGHHLSGGTAVRTDEASYPEFHRYHRRHYRRYVRRPDYRIPVCQALPL